MPPAVLAAAPLVISGISAIGGLVSGKQAADSNQQIINNQNQQLLMQQQMGQRLANSVSRADYQEMASKDSRSALRDVFTAMSQRGVGLSTAATTSAAGASAQIRSQYSKQYVTDRLSAISGAAGIFGQGASTQRFGYDTDPYANARAGMTGIANGAAYMQKNAPTPGSAATPVPTSTLQSGPYDGSNFGVHYKWP